MSDGGDRSLFERTVLPHLDAAYNVARWLLRDESEARDVVQEATMRALKYFSSFRGEDALPWLLRIVRNTAFTVIEKRKREEGVESLGEDEVVMDMRAVDPAAVMMERVDAEALRRAVEGLPAEFREAIVMRELEGMSYKEIAAATEVSVGTVMSRLSRGRKRLQMVLMEGGIEKESEVDHGL